jgi:hypothetical protein
LERTLFHKTFAVGPRGQGEDQNDILPNWLSFSSGVPGFSFGWVLQRESVLRVEIYIDKGDKAQNKEAFDALVNQKEAMEKEIGASLDWDRLEQAQASRISISRSFIFEEPQSVRDPVKAWGVDMMLKFIDAFQPRIRNL